jgi:hypothetical protein
VEIEPELRRTSDALLDGVNRIRELEHEKRTLPPGSPRFLQLAEEVEELSREVLRRSEREEHLGRRSAELQGRGLEHLADRPIDDIPPPRGADIVFVEWTEAERRLAELDPESPDAEAARKEARRLRDEWAGTSTGSHSEE